ncbi:MAG: PhzF family phenazine biosynthesis protein [Rhodocyclaceae bacterium]|nr:PhzF family phenazine biosynthesis protein [Pseudomonadota bacterium]MDQ7973716.1 PhzF family phenazine biosynthesis protein [Rhodocyclaceae bacterium]MDQ7999256.1 PhzF family phenazine biosynthesis protein [Pseudomonadota bacterium]MDQ8018572.1 PhzF family phenazine biosynthesis protein [Pseudomonadota bacterium]
MNVQHIAAFSDGARGGNPAGVVIGDALPPDARMQQLATELGYSESVFAAPHPGGGWRVRYFSPAAEVPFCGHATIALGAALALAQGDGVFDLAINHARITVAGRREGALVAAALQSPPTRSRPLAPALRAEALALFGLAEDELDPRLPPALAHGGADHVVLALRTRAALAAMRYDFDAGRALMQRAGLATIALVHAQTDRHFHARNAFAGGGVAEDPATGAAAAALGGYLRDLGWPHGGAIDIVQGEDMGVVCRLHVDIPPEPGASVRVSGTARMITA